MQSYPGQVMGFSYIASALVPVQRARTHSPVTRLNAGVWSGTQAERWLYWQ